MVLRYDSVGTHCIPGERPGLSRLKEWMWLNYPGTFLGIYLCRDIRTGETLSLHAEGRALDWKWPERATFDEVAAILVANADALNVQAVHDYDNSMLWRPKQGWHHGNIGVGPRHEMHVERNWLGAYDDRPIASILPGGKPVPTPPPKDEDDMWVQQCEVLSGSTGYCGIAHNSRDIVTRVICPDQKTDANSGAGLWGARLLLGNPGAWQGLWGGGKTWELWLPPLATIADKLCEGSADAYSGVILENRGPNRAVIVVSGYSK